MKSTTQEIPMNASTDIAIRPQDGAIARAETRRGRFTQQEIDAAQHIDEATEFPALHGEDVRIVPASLSIDYWSPSEPGEQKRVWIIGIAPMPVMQIDFSTGEQLGTADMDCVCFLEEKPDGSRSRGYTSARLLLSYVNAAIARAEIIPGKVMAPVIITYLGKKTTKSRRQISAWDIRPLIVATQE